MSGYAEGLTKEQFAHLRDNYTHFVAGKPSL
jgi:hypothetical protein